MRRAALELRTELGPGVTIVADPVASHAPLDSLVREFAKYVLRRAALLTAR